MSNETAGYLAEFNALRSEILKRIEQRQQIIVITLTLAGTFLGFGVKDGNETISLIYPIIAAFLAFAWTQNDLRIKDLAKYIREAIEPQVPGLQYETTIHRLRQGWKGVSSIRFVSYSHEGLFVVTQAIAILIGFSNPTITTLDWVLIGLDFLAVGLVVWLISQTRKRDPNSKP